jgi:hypothetical protein
MDGTIVIHKPDGSELITVTFDADSYMRWQVMGEHAVTLNFSHAGFLEVPVGSYITYKSQRYTLYSPSNFTKNANRNYGYTLKLEAHQSTMADSIFINIPDGRTSFTRTARPQEFLQSLVDNLNREDSGWTAGAYIETTQKTVSFNETNCAEALRLMAEAFNTEWEVNGKEISLRKVEYFKSAPLALQYGQGNGFKPGLGRGNFDNSRPVNRLFVRGGERNIDFSTYGSQTLLLPSGQSLAYDGTYFQDESGFNSTIARTYTVSGDGRSFIRTDGQPLSKREGSVELTEIYPMRKGEVTRVLWYYKGVEYTTYADAYAVAKLDPATDTTGIGAIFCDMFDSSIPASLDYTNNRLDGEQMIVVFQTGMLSGREIGVLQDEESVTGYVHVDPSDPSKNRRFKLITEYVDGYPMPGSNFSPIVGDKYAVFGMKMPDAYVREDATKSGASWDLFREAVRYKYENEDYRFTFKGEMDGIWAQKNWDAIEDKIVAGGYVLFSDPQFQPEGVLIRISAIKEYLHEPYKPTLELTNVVIGGGVRGELAKIDQQEVVIDDRIRDIATLSNRQWRDTQELRRRLNDLHLGFTEAITPISVQTMQLIAGSEQLQLRFVSNKIYPIEVRPTIVYDPAQNRLSVQAGIIQHMTLGIDAITAIHAFGEYKFWDVNAFTSVETLEDDKLYWLYAKVPRTDTVGNFVLTADGFDMNEDPNYYYLLVGALNSEYDGNRSYSSLYGFTEVLPGQVVVNLLRSADGRNYFDLIDGKFRSGKFGANGMIAGIDIDPTAADNAVLKIKGAVVQSPSGAEDAIGVFRGNYDPTKTYYKGDEVFYNGSTYRYINAIGQGGITPPNASYWAVRASAGRYTAEVFRASSSKPTKPTGSGLIPTGWTEQPPETDKIISNITYSGDVWTDSNGYKKSPSVSSIGISKQRLTFTTKQANEVLEFDIQSSSEAGYDFMLIGLPNNPDLSRTSNYTDRVSGIGVSKTVSVNFTSAGTNYIEFAYAKDSSGVGGGDYGMYRMIANNDLVLWVSRSVVEQDENGEWTAIGWSDPVQWSGKSGNNGRMFSYTGEYDNAKSYTGDSKVAQVVKVGDQCYYTTATAGTFSGVQPPNLAYWTIFGANFESIATGLLLAENANLAGLIFHDEKLISQTGTINGIASTDFTNPNFIPNIVIDGRIGHAELSEALIRGKFESNKSGSSITIDPLSRSIILRNDSGVGVGSWIFDNEGSRIHLTRYTGVNAGAMLLDANTLSVQSGGTGNSRMLVEAQAGGLSFSLSNLPTSAQGLGSGRVWRDGNTLRIVP